MQKRKRSRVEFTTSVSLETKNYKRIDDADSKDISLNGVFVSTDVRIPVGTNCNILVKLPGGVEDVILNIEVVISRHTEEGMGVNFDAMDPESFNHLKNIAMYNSSDPDEIEKEIAKIPLK